MKTYIVGGYVRNRLLNLPAKDHDFVVVAENSYEDLEGLLVNQGFNKINASFPVFKHPITGDEYAIELKERKTGHGHTGFEISTDTVTLREDLKRRDFTINAMAREVLGYKENGHAILSDEIIDPFNGQADLRNKVLRPVSSAFAEDPLRAVRALRFAAQYDLTLSESCVEAINKIVASNEITQNIPKTRIWNELHKALQTKPSVFFYLLTSLPGLCEQMFGVELDCRQLVAELRVIEKYCSTYTKSRAAFACFTYQLMKQSPEAFTRFEKDPAYPKVFLKHAERLNRTFDMIMDNIVGRVHVTEEKLYCDIFKICNFSHPAILLTELDSLVLMLQSRNLSSFAEVKTAMPFIAQFNVDFLANIGTHIDEKTDYQSLLEQARLLAATIFTRNRHILREMQALT